MAASNRKYLLIKNTRTYIFSTELSTRLLFINWSLFNFSTIYFIDVPLRDNIVIQSNIKYYQLNQSIELNCKTIAFPPPMVTWYRNNTQLQPGNNVMVSKTFGINYYELNSNLQIKGISQHSTDSFKCHAVDNRYNRVFESQAVAISN